MKFTAKIKDIGRTLSGSLTITLESRGIDTTAVMELFGIDQLDVEIKKQRRKRSLDANAYYWVLVTKLAGVLRISNEELHNILLSKYGFLEVAEGNNYWAEIPDTEEAHRKVMDSPFYHLKPTSNVKMGEDGVMYRTYLMIRGSSTYNTVEMSRLIDGLVSECKNLGIETLPPEELKRMMAAYGKRHGKGNTCRGQTTEERR